MTETREFKLASWQFDKARAEVDRVNRRAAKLGVAGFTLEIVRTETEDVYRRDALGGVMRDAPIGQRTWLFVALTGEAVKVAGWTIIASLEHDDEGNFVMSAPGYEGSLAEYRTVDQRCDHCGIDLRRIYTVALENEAGERKLVGRTCLKDFLGQDAGDTLSRLAWFASLTDLLDGGFGDGDDDDGFGGGGGGGRIAYLTDEYLGEVIASIAAHGYHSRSNGDYPTADAAMNNLRARRKEHRTNDYPTEEMVEEGRAAREWISDLYNSKNGDVSDFDYNLWRAALGDYLPDRGIGFIAYLPMAYRRAMQREVERKQASAKSEFVGTVGKREKLRLTVANVFEHDGRYGLTYITKLLDADGNRLTWFGSYGLERGSTVEAVWTIKDHKDDARYGKETVVNRPAKLTVVEDG